MFEATIENNHFGSIVDQWARFSRPATMGVIISYEISEPSAVSSHNKMES
jgi:hypothetical protein